MQRELCLVLDTLGEHRLVLKSGTNYEIDEYTSKNFEDSSQIREKYKKEIDEFLNKYKTSLQKSNKPDYEGRIVIVIPENIGMDMKFYQRKVLLKKHIVAFNEAVDSQILMRRFAEFEKLRRGSQKLVSDYFCNIIKQPWNNRNAIKGFIKKWLKEEKTKKKDYYEIVRDMMIVYEKDRQFKGNLLSIDELYSEYKKEKSRKLKERIEKRGSMKVQKDDHAIVENSITIEESDEKQEQYYQINGNKYTIDELHLFDIEDIKLDEYNSDYIPDGAKKI